MSKLKEIEANIENKELLKKIRSLRAIPNDNNEFAKAVEFQDSENFMLDVTKRNELSEMFFNQSELKTITASDLTYCLAYAYEWVYGFKDENDEFKATANIPKFDGKILNSDAQKILSSVEKTEKLVKQNAGIKEFEKENEIQRKIVFKILNIKEDEELSDWEIQLAIKQVIDFIYNPMGTAMGLLSKN